MEAVSSYIQILERQIDCPKGIRGPFLKRTRRAAEQFLQDKPEATRQELADYLGEPQELAQGFLETLDPDVLERYHRRKKFLRRSCVAILAVTLVVVSALFVWHLSLPMDAEITYTTIVHHESMEG